MSISLAEWASLACALIWSINGLILRTQSQHVTPIAMNAVRCAIAGAAFWIVIPLDEAPFSNLINVTIHEWVLFLAALSFGVAVGDTFYLIAIKEAGVSRTLAITGTFPLATLAWQTLLLDAPLTTSLIVGSIMVVCGVAILSRSGIADQKPIRLYWSIVLALGASVCWGFSATLLKPATVHMSAIQANAIRMPLIAILLFSVRLLPNGNKKLGKMNFRSFLIVSATGLLGMGIGAYLFVYAITQTNPAKVVTITASSPLFGMLLAAVFLKEHITLHNTIGILLCMAGVYAVL